VVDVQDVYLVIYVEMMMMKYSREIESLSDDVIDYCGTDYCGTMIKR